MNYTLQGTNKNPKKLIDFFGGEYSFLCNFYEQPLQYDGMWCASSESAFAAQKTTRISERMRIVRMSPGAAKAAGRALKLRAGWDKIKFGIMSEIVHAKFSQNPQLAERLVATGTARLVEGNTWNDTIWGVVNGKGTNWLGVILMAERAYWNEITKQRGHEWKTTTQFNPSSTNRLSPSSSRLSRRSTKVTAR